MLLSSLFCSDPTSPMEMTSTLVFMKMQESAFTRLLFTSAHIHRPWNIQQLANPLTYVTPSTPSRISDKLGNLSYCSHSWPLHILTYVVGLKHYVILFAAQTLMLSRTTPNNDAEPLREYSRQYQSYCNANTVERLRYSRMYRTYFCNGSVQTCTLVK